MKIVAALLLLSVAAQAGWTPPRDVQPRAVLRQANEDASAGRFADALAKHVWFHENAFRLDQGMAGVRLSFALEAWSELGKSYPPALAALRKARDTAEVKVKANPVDYFAFLDASSLNSHLVEEGRTVALFQWLDEHFPVQAKKTFAIAEPDLIAAKEIALCGKYLQPETDFGEMVKMFQLIKGISIGPRAESRIDFAQKKFTSDASTLVALLVLNERKTEAQSIYDKAMLEWNSKKLKDQLDQALAGNVPARFPLK